MKVLHFSGGIDSLACLLLLKDEPDLTVLTILTDGAYPSMVEYLDKLHEALPQVHFVVRRTHRHLEVYGQPVDVVPMRWTPMGQGLRGTWDVRYQDTFSCCNRGIWWPLEQATKELGATTVYKGTRNDDRLRWPVEDGHVEGGVTLRLPVADWTREQVFEYVKGTAPDLMPPSYIEGEKTSRDCWNCTAYLEDNQNRIANLPPKQFERVNGLIAQWHADVAAEMENSYGRS